MAWPVPDTTSRVHYGGIASAGFADNGSLSGGAGGRTFIIGTITTERVMQDGDVMQIKLLSFNSPTDATGCKAKIFRINGTSHDYVGESSTFTISTTGALETFTLGTGISAQPGDIIGIYVPSTGDSILTVKTSSGTNAIRYIAGDITSNTATASFTGIDNLSLNLEFLGAEPLACCSGDSIIGGHNLSATTTAHWRTYHDGDGPAGVATAEPFNQLKGLISSTTFTYQNFAKGAQEYTWVNSTGMPSCVIAKGPIVLAAGVNDIANGTVWATVETALNNIKAQLTGVQRLFISEILPWTNGSDANASTVRTFNTNLATWCAANTATLISTWSAMGQLRVSTGLNDNLLTAYDFDGVHLTQAGVDALAALYKTALENYYVPASTLAGRMALLGVGG